MSADNRSLEERAVGLLREWLIANHEFDIESWVKRVRDLVEDEVDDK